jgi:hypothetical protein
MADNYTHYRVHVRVYKEKIVEDIQAEYQLLDIVMDGCNVGQEEVLDSFDTYDEAIAFIKPLVK